MVRKIVGVGSICKKGYFLVSALPTLLFLGINFLLFPLAEKVVG